MVRVSFSLVRNSEPKSNYENTISCNPTQLKRLVYTFTRRRYHP